MTSCVWTHSLIIISGPAVALLYAMSCWLCFAVTGECKWHDKNTTLSLRLGFLIAAIAYTEKMCGQDKSTTKATVLWSGLVLWPISFYLLYLTRVDDVVGIAHPPNWGPNHLKGKVVLVTGANAGIGKETTLQLASMGATVVLMCRSKKRARQAMNELVSRGGVDNALLQFCPLDLGDFQSVRNSINCIQKDLKLSRIDILVNNAGLMMGTKTKSKDRLELMMQANHLGHFLLTRLLMDCNLLSDDARILNLTSSTYEQVKNGFDFEDMFCKKQRSYSLFGQYTMTKLANILFSKELARLNPNFQVYAVHPGIVRTNVTSNMNWYWRWPYALFYWFVIAMQKTTRQGAFCTVFCAAAPSNQLPPSGSYMANCKIQFTNEHANSPPDAKKLWEVSEQLVGLTDDLEEDAFYTSLQVKVEGEVESNTLTPYILTQEQINQIAVNVLPKTIAFCRWRRLYFLARDGDSFDSCMRTITDVQRTLMVIRTTRGAVFGGYADSPWQSRHHGNTKFYGSAQACLFSVGTDNKLNVYKWTGKNRYIQLCEVSTKLLAFGGGGDDGAFGLCVEEDFQRGSTGPCDTFDNQPLCDQEFFDIVDLEFWEFLTVF